MCKKLSNSILCLMVLVFGMWSFGFTASFVDILEQAKTDVFRMSDVFGGNFKMSNLYTKALKLSKQREVKVLSLWFTYVADRYKQQYACPSINVQDVINVLYPVDDALKVVLDTLLFDWASVGISKTERTKSMLRFLECQRLEYVQSNVDAIIQQLKDWYYASYSAYYALETVDQDNYGADLFWNGSLEDSSFDLLYDIQKVGKLLFEQFSPSPQILFYRLPTFSSFTQDWWTNTVFVWWWDTFGVDIWWIWWSHVLGDMGWWLSFSLSSPQTSSSQTFWSFDWLVATDTWLSSFASTLGSYDPFVSQRAFSSLQCPVSGDVDESQIGIFAGVSDSLSVSETPMTAQEYLDALDHFFDYTSTQEGLLAVSSVVTDASSPNTYVVVDGGASSHACAHCSSLPLWEQAQCQLDCVRSCVAWCDSVVWVAEKALCVAQCTCTLISGPRGAWWEKVEDMFRIKFCTIPSVMKTVSPGKKVFTIQAIFQEILDVLEWLRDSGEMVKFSKTKEYLDGTIKISLADNFAFRLWVWFKPIFPQRPSVIKQQEAIQSQESLANIVLNTPTRASADDYNKYVIVSDIYTNEAQQQPFVSLEALEKNIQQAQYIANIQQVSSSKLLALRQQTTAQQPLSFLVSFQDFLDWQVAFWSFIAQTLVELNTMAYQLVSKVEQAK